jgi:hypothetical protein
VRLYLLWIGITHFLLQAQPCHKYYNSENRENSLPANDLIIWFSFKVHWHIQAVYSGFANETAALWRPGPGPSWLAFKTCILQAVLSWEIINSRGCPLLDFGVCTRCARQRPRMRLNRSAFSWYVTEFSSYYQAPITAIGLYWNNTFLQQDLPVTSSWSVTTRTP